MGIFRHLQKTWKSEETKQLMKDRMISWRRQPVILRIRKPTRLDRAHALGYKAKQGFALARVRIGKGTSKRETPAGGRKPGNTGKIGIKPSQNLQHIAEARVGRRFPNMEVLNSYYVCEDGRQIWFEIIMVDPESPSIKKDPKMKWICEPQNRNRVLRGLTSAGKKSRMLRGKGRGFERRLTRRK